MDNNKTIESFVNWHSNRAKRQSTERYEFILNRLVRFADGKQLKELTNEDITNYLGEVKRGGFGKPKKDVNLEIAALKVFYNWLFKLPKKTYPECLFGIYGKDNKKDLNRLKGKILTQDDILKILRGANNRMQKALLTVLFEGCLRISEALTLTVGDIERHENKKGRKWINIHVRNGKGGKSRVITLTDTVDYLIDYLNEEHPKADDDTALLFFSRGDKRTEKGELRPINRPNAYKMIKKMARRGGLKKEIWPHLLRHSGLTLMAKAGFNEHERAVFAGHSNYSMQQIYTHMSDSDVQDKKLMKAGIKTESEEANPLKPVVCMNCGAFNLPDHKFCSNCAYDLYKKDEEKRFETDATTLRKELEKMKQMLSILIDTPEYKERLKERGLVPKG